MTKRRRDGDITRRELLAGLSATAGYMCVPGAARADTAWTVLEAKPGSASLLEDGGPKTPVWGYNGEVPGPTIRVPKGGTVSARLVNSLEQPTTIHWHGIRIDNAMDGAGHLTQDPVAPGGTFDYRFRVPDAGTFWYHPHAHEPMQQGRGLSGLLIVEEDEPVAVDREMPLVIDDWRLLETGEFETRSLAVLRDAAHAGRIGNIITTNGAPFGNFSVQANERIRLRLCSPCNARVLQLRLSGIKAHIVAVDGQPVEPEPLADGRLTLPPAGRVDLCADIVTAPGGKAAYYEVSRGEIELGAFNVKPGDKKRARPLVDPVRLPGNDVPRPRIDNDALRFDLVMGGGAHGGMAGAIYNGQYLDLRSLARKHRMVWAFNGVASPHDAPLFRVDKGRTVVVRMINNTAWPHAMHTHGHHFVVHSRSEGDVKPWLHDTILMQPHEIVEIAFAATNPGKWMFHCHMLEHQMSGMQAWFEVRDLV